MDFTDPERQTLLAGIHEQTRVMRSTNGGTTWADISATLPPGVGFTSYPVAQSASTYLLGTNNGTSSGHLPHHRCGCHMESGLPRRSARHAPRGHGRRLDLLDALGVGGIVKSTDGGQTWMQVGKDGTVSPLAPYLVELPDGRLAAVGRTVVISSDGGTSWRSVGPGTAHLPHWARLLPVPQGVLHLVLRVLALEHPTRWRPTPSCGSTSTTPGYRPLPPPTTRHRHGEPSDPWSGR